MPDNEDKAVATFIANLAQQGIDAAVEGPSVVYSMVVVAGGLVGQTIPTAVSISELSAWPAVPPHWIHFPASVKFVRTNPDPSDCLPGWLRHSREIGTWSADQTPVVRWLAHVRGVVAEASS